MSSHGGVARRRRQHDGPADPHGHRSTAVDPPRMKPEPEVGQAAEESPRRAPAPHELRTFVIAMMWFLVPLAILVVTDRLMR